MEDEKDVVKKQATDCHWTHSKTSVIKDELYTSSLAVFRDNKAYKIDFTSKKVIEFKQDERKRFNGGYWFIQNKNQPMSFKVQALAHDTDPKAWCRIVFEGMHGKPKSQQALQNLCLSWWHLNIPPAELQQQLGDQFSQSQVGCIFGGESKWGDCRIPADFSALKTEYLRVRTRNYIPNPQICFRFLGTFVYKQQIMYAILVCIRSVFVFLLRD